MKAEAGAAIGARMMSDDDKEPVNKTEESDGSAEPKSSGGSKQDDEVSKEEVSKEKDEKEEDKDTKDRPGGEGKEGGGDCRREKSLGLLSQKFVQLFLVSRARVVSLEAAARTLLGSSADSAKLKTKVRRLYDIANILSSLRLIEKTHLVLARRVPLAGRGEGPRRRRRRRSTARPAPRSAPSHRGRNCGAHRHERADARVQPALLCPTRSGAP